MLLNIIQPTSSPVYSLLVRLTSVSSNRLTMVKVLFRTCGFWIGGIFIVLFRSIDQSMNALFRRIDQSMSTENQHLMCKSRFHSWMNLVSYYEYNYTCIWYLDFICGWRWNGHLNLWLTWALNTRDILKSIFEQNFLKMMLECTFHISAKRSLRGLRGCPPPPTKKIFFLLLREQ